MKRHGFTLIELLIVIALLGTLAVALLAAIDPFEQFRKGQDTGTRNTVQEVFNAAIRYYALQNAWPAEWDPSDTWILTTEGQALSDWNQGTTPETNTFLDPLISAGELKDNFIDLARGDLDRIFVMQRTPTTDQERTESHIAVCFMPSSNAFQEADANTKFLATGSDLLPHYTGTVNQETPEQDVDGSNCRTGSGTNNCYWCVN